MAIDIMSKPLHGLRRVRRIVRPDGEGSDFVVEASCSVCGAAVLRTSAAVKLARREDRSFTCSLCNVQRTLRIRGKR